MQKKPLKMSPRLSPSTMSAQFSTNESLMQIDMTLQGYTSHFVQQDKTMAKIKTTMTELKTSVVQIKTDITNFTTKFQ